MAVRTIDVREKVMARNDQIASLVRERLHGAGVASLNLVSSPGSGKTTLLERTVAALGEELGIAVVAGDVQTQNDADRLARHTRRLVQAVVTGGACHLDARQIEDAVNQLDLNATRLLIIENVGNLVCPANYDLGEAVKVVVASVTEGDDKPLKYPTMFRNAAVMIINKIDLLPYVNSSIETLKRNALSINPSLVFFETSCTKGTGIAEWSDWLIKKSLVKV